MRKSYLSYITVTAALLLSSCGVSTMNDEGGLQSLDQIEVPVVMAVLPDAVNGETPVATDAIGLAECAINPKNLYIATYTEAGNLIEVLFNGGIPSTNASQTQYFGNTAWGPSIAFTLNKEKHSEYNSDFCIAAFAVSKQMNASFGFNQTVSGENVSWSNYNTESGASTLANLGTTLTFPSVSDSWEPSSDIADNGEDLHIPMAGYVKVSQEYLNTNYKPEVLGTGPLRLPSIPMTRAMAKIIIEDIDDIIASAQFKTNNLAELIPQQDDGSQWWSVRSAGRRVHLPAETQDPVTLTVTGGNASRQEGGRTIKQYIFYVFEHEFYNKGVKDDSRKLITLTAQAGKVSSTTKDIYIAPYQEGGSTDPDSEITDLNTRDAGAWSGILRNHCYTFQVRKPDNVDIIVEIKTPTMWDYHRDGQELPFN